MPPIRQQIEHFFEQLSHRLYRHAFLVIIAMLVLTSLAAIQVPNLRIDTSNESFFHPDDPTLLRYKQFKQDFDRDQLVLVGLQTDNVFTLPFLNTLKQLHHRLEQELPFLDEVISLANATSVYGRGEELVVEDLLAQVPQTEEALNKLRMHVLAHPVYPNFLVSEDGRLAAVLIRPLSHQASEISEDDLMTGFDNTSSEKLPAEPLSQDQIHQLIKAIRDIVAEFETDNIKAHIAGEIVITDDTLQAMNQDIPSFTIISIGLIASFLFILYRRIYGVILPLITVGLSLLATLGTMAWSGTSFTVFTQILPSFLLAIGIGNSLHLLTIFFASSIKPRTNRLL